MAKKFGESGIKLLLTGLMDYFLQIKDAVKSVCGVEPDENGDIPLQVVPYAQNLESESSRRNIGSFIQRTAGGEGTVSNGDAWLMSIRGNAEHDGFVAEVLEMAVNPMERATPITATISRADFIEAASGSGTYSFNYSTDWDNDPASYGITVTGTPVAGDNITVEYVEEERGTISVANPSAFVATGWNLFDYTAGYAKVVKYMYGYRIDGTYTALKYSATVDGTKTDISVNDGNFDVPADGYVWVTGGSAEDTAIYMTWEDWTEEYGGDFEAYGETEIDLSTIMETYFPHGLLKVGSVADEIDLNLKQAISRVERMDYSEANRAIAEASGREYDFDEDYIYLAKQTPTTSTITGNGAFTVNDHGLEYFTYTEVPVEAEILYGNNLKNKLERDTVTISQQSLTDQQKSQIRENIGAASKAEVDAINAANTVTNIAATAWTWGNNYVSGDAPSISFLAMGRFRALRLTITPKNTNSAWTTIGTIAEGHRPLHYLSTYAEESVTSPNPKHVRITKAGVCEIYNRGTSTYSLNFIWFV